MRKISLGIMLVLSLGLSSRAYADYSVKEDAVHPGIYDVSGDVNGYIKEDSAHPGVYDFHERGRGRRVN